MIIIDNILDAEYYLEQIEGVVFDLDDTLYSEKTYVKSGYNAIAEAFPQVEDMAEKLWQAFLQGEKAIDVVMKDEICRITTPTEEALQEYKQKALNIYRFHNPVIRLYPGMEALLKRLRGSGKQIGIITDGRPEGQRAKLKALKLEAYVDYVIITDELGGPEFRKPNSAAFEAMQDKMKLPYTKMCYVGDNLNKDFIAPEKLGMLGIYFRNEDGLY